MSNLPPLICPAPRISKACESCRSRKLRCLPSDSDGVCKRCLSLGNDCRFAANSGLVARPGGRRKEQPAVSKPTSRTPNTTDSADDEDVLNSLFQSKPEPKLNPLGMIKSIHQQIFDKILPSSPYWSSSTTPLSQSVSESPTLSVEKIEKNHPRTAPKLGKDDIRRYLTKFQKSQTYFPFIRLSQNITMEVMMKRHPFLLLGILSAMSMPDIYIHQRLDAKFRRVLSEKTIERDEKSLDLLQGLLVYLAWFPIHLNPKSLQIFKFLQMAVGLAVDLKLDQHTDVLFDAVDFDSASHSSPIALGKGAAISHTERLAYLGCYYLSTSILLPFGRLNTLPFTQYMQFCVDGTPVDEIDARAHVLVKAQRLAEQASELSKNGVQPGSLSFESQIQSLIEQLDTIQQNLPPTIASHLSVILSLDFTRQRIYAIPLPFPKCQIHPPTPQSSILLSKCLSSVITIMTYMIVLPVAAYETFTLAEWNHVIDIIVTLSRLCFSIPSIPAWDAAAARQSTNFVPLMTDFQKKMDDVVRYLGSSITTSSKAGGNEENERRRINIPALFSAVLSIVLQQYEERVAQEIYLSPDVFDLNPVFPQNLPGQPTTYPMKSGQCPVMNGSLKGTEYWDAMGAFKSDISADAWMGGPEYLGGGNEVFEPAVLDDWYLWGTKLPEWDEGLVR